MSEILSFTVAFIAVQIFKIIMFKKDKDVYKRQFMKSTTMVDWAE